MMTINNPQPDEPLDVSGFSILSWIYKNGIRNEKGEALSFYDRRFLLDILTDWSRQIVIKKCSQVGGSVIFNLKALFAIKTWGWNIIYTFPTDDDVREFVSSKTNKLLTENPHVFAGLPTDNIERKELNGRFLFFKGTVSKTAAIMTSADCVIHDEASRSNQPVMTTYKSRTKASKFKGRWLFSNPTTEKDEIDQAWHKSDQKEWHVQCPSCKQEQQLQWPLSIDPVRKCYQCIHCKAELSDDVRRSGRWIAAFPERTISGYHISHLMAPWISAAEILEESEGDQEYFFNFILGEPYNPGDFSISPTMFLDNWTPESLVSKRYYLGVDVGNIKHWVLGSERGVIKVGRFTKWSDLDDMMKLYNPILVIDANPDNTQARHFVETYRNASMSVFKENKDNPKVIVWWGKGSEENDRKGIVYSNRNRILDELIDVILRAKILYGVANNAEFKRYIKHWETLRRVKEVDSKGIETYVWESTTGEDHFVFATLYYYLAVLGMGNGVFFADPKRDSSLPTLIKDNVMGDIGEIISQANNWD